jgi:hypothetical protein
VSRAGAAAREHVRSAADGASRRRERYEKSIRPSCVSLTTRERPSIVSTPAGGPSLLLNLVLEPRELAVPNLPQMLSLGVELGTPLARPLEVDGHDDCVALVVDLLDGAAEVIEVVGDG